MKRHIGLALLAAAIALAQDAAVWDAMSYSQIYLAYREASLSGAAEAVTVQQPASGAKNVYLDGAMVYCSADCDVTLERNGTAATTTSFTPVGVNPGITVAKARAFHTSNAGVGTVLAKYKIQGGTSQSMALRGVRLRWNAADNLTVRVGTMTGDVKILVRWGEA